MQGWQNILKNSITRAEDLPVAFGPIDEGVALASQVYPMRINPYYLSLIRQKGDPLWKQAVPCLEELRDDVCFEDPLNEENLSPVPNLIHKYPDRVLFLVCSQCAMYCRFCTRKRKVGTSRMVITRESLAAGIAYIENHPEIRDVLISGGDPLLLSDEQLDEILTAVRRIPTVEIIRIGTRVPCTLPMRVTVRLAGMLKKFHPLYINTHFNHPAEITPEAAKACGRLAGAGIPLSCQTVLLRGVNDDPLTMRELMQKLLRIRVRPYYLFQADMTRGTNHFRTPVALGKEIMRSLIGHTSGLAVPTYALDAPGGGGKIPLLPDYVREEGEQLVFANYRGMTCFYDNSC
ncbi:MAG: KamA family radical SAM protein [Deltaproteobacteria bacterium]|nr:KamA family radical SAM protein [Deltaproteobacteria bacterium]